MHSNYVECDHCGNEFSDEAERCPHCGRPGLYVNVIRAEKDKERNALTRRYDAAIRDAQARGCENVVRDFETAAARSKAATARSGPVVQRLASSDTEVFGTYLQEVRAGLRLPEGEGWDLLRKVADATLFGTAGEQIRFAALTLDAKGLFSYGDYAMFFREDMIAHRTSVFEDNSALFVERHRRTAASPEGPPGFRAPWHERARLCVAKLADRIFPNTNSSEYAKILLTPGKKSVDDQFVEVHIWGPVTVRTLERVVVRKRAVRKGARSAWKQFRAKLKKYGVALEEI